MEEKIELPPPEVVLSFDSEHRLRSENLSFDIDVWYPNLKDFTFRSVFIPLKRIEAKAIKSFHDVSWRHVKAMLDDDEVETLLTLEREITETIRKEFSGIGDGRAFLRLCGRSPKDGEPLDRLTPVRDYLRNIKELLTDADAKATVSTILETDDLEGNSRRDLIAKALHSVKPVDVTIKIAAMANVSWLHVRDGKEALSLLLTSERVYAEMIDWLKYGEPEQLCLREWEADLHLSNEFRVFVYQGRVTAISQYDHYGYYPHLHANKDKFEAGILAYWAIINQHIRVHDGSYVVDIGYLPSTDSYILIELSPFTPCTGAALFSWREDINVLTGKSDSASTQEVTGALLTQPPVVFRIKELDHLHPQLDQLVELNWDDRWLEERQPYWDVFSYGREDSESRTRSVTSVFQSVSSTVSSLFRQARTQIPPASPKHLLFVYGTLKSNFQWNIKYLSPRLGCSFVGPAITLLPMALVVGDCGVPYVLGDVSDSFKSTPMDSCAGYRIQGELWSVDDAALRGLDDYEGLAKGYYDRITIQVECAGGDISSLQIKDAHVYVLRQSTEDLRARPFLPEYSMRDHQEHYCPILHIQRKQMAYIGAPSTWGKTDTLIEGGLSAPSS